MRYDSLSLLMACMRAAQLSGLRDATRRTSGQVRVVRASRRSDAELLLKYAREPTAQVRAQISKITHGSGGCGGGCGWVLAELASRVGNAASGRACSALRAFFLPRQFPISNGEACSRKGACRLS